MSALLDPLTLPFFRNGMIVATIAGALCGMIGVYVVLRGMSYIGHGLSHAIFGGAVVSVVAKVNFTIGAAAWGFLSALAINRVARRRSIGADAAIGVITTASFAVGIAIISRTSALRRNFDAALFGNVLGVTPGDVAVVAAVLAVAVTMVFTLYRPLLFLTFDPEVAEASGVRTGAVDAAFSLVLAATIVATMNVLGVLLIAAALVIPPVIARMLTNSFRRMLILATAIGAAGGLAGMYASYFVDIASGPAIVIFEAAVFVAVYLGSGLRGVRGLPAGAVD